MLTFSKIAKHFGLTSSDKYNFKNSSKNVKFKIAEYLSYVDVLHFTSTCKTCYKLRHDSVFWVYLILKHFNRRAFTGTHAEYRKICMQQIFKSDDHKNYQVLTDSLYHVFIEALFLRNGEYLQNLSKVYFQDRKSVAIFAGEAFGKYNGQIHGVFNLLNLDEDCLHHSSTTPIFTKMNLPAYHYVLLVF